MTITVNLRPQIESQIVAQATAQNLSVENYIEKVIENLVGENQSSSLEEFERDMDQLIIGLENFQTDYKGTYSREDIYFDHD